MFGPLDGERVRERDKARTGEIVGEGRGESHLLRPVLRRTCCVEVRQIPVRTDGTRSCTEDIRRRRQLACRLRDVPDTASRMYARTAADEDWNKPEQQRTELNRLVGFRKRRLQFVSFAKEVCFHFVCLFVSRTKTTM